MGDERYDALSIVLVGLVARIENLCKLLIKKGVITEDDLNQLNSDLITQLEEIYSEELKHENIS